ncbi:DNA glycosylase, partial [Tanacetum coccineum]
ATLGDAIRTSPARSTVNCSIGDQPEIAICSLIVPNLTCCQLDLEFHESHDVIFSVKGPRGIHLAGYFVTPAADIINDGKEVPNGDEVQEKTQSSDAIVTKKKKRNKKNKKKKASTIGPTASGYVSDTESEMLEARLTKKNGSTNDLKRSEDKLKAKMEASTIEPMASGYVNAVEDDKFGSESRIIKENGSTNALERGEDKEDEKKNRKRKASTIEPTASGYVSPSEDDKFGSANAIELSEGTVEKKKKKKKKSRSRRYMSHDKNPSMGDMNGDSPSLTIEGQLPEMSKTILVECEVKGAGGAKSKLEKAVCNHGFFMMAPNRWDPSSKTLVRPLRLPDQKSVTVSVKLLCRTFLSIDLLDYVHDKISPSDRKAISDQVKRMLSLSTEGDEHVERFQRLHSDAAERGFGRLFRNATLFEDIVKSILLCACRFKDSLEMAEKLCTFQRQLINSKRKRGKNPEVSNFPSPQELARIDLKDLKKSFGFRGEKILKLAKDVTNGEINLLDLENLSDADTVYNKLKDIEGIGDFVARNVLMCMGFYHKVPVDSETIRHIKQVHQRQECSKKNVEAIIKEIYDKYAPFQTLAFWFELVNYYEENVGKLWKLKECDYKRVAGSFINNRG